MGNDAELDVLRRGLAERVRDHPPSTWSRRLLTLVAAAVDIEFGTPDPEDSGPPTRWLQVVK